MPKQHKRGKNRKGSKLTAAKKTAAKPAIITTAAPFYWKTWFVGLLPKDSVQLSIMAQAFSSFLVAVERFLTHLKL